MGFDILEVRLYWFLVEQEMPTKWIMFKQRVAPHFQHRVSPGVMHRVSPDVRTQENIRSFFFPQQLPRLPLCD